MAHFPSNDIISLVDSPPRHDLAESTGPDLRLSDCPGYLDGDLNQLGLGYGSVAGDVELREQIARAHGVDTDDVVVTAGGQHALFLLAFTLCDRGDEAIVASPGFPMPGAALTAVGGALRSLTLSFEENYQPDPDRLRALLTPKTRLVCLASPHNPSGVTIEPERLREIVAMVANIAPQAHLCIDETYRDAGYGNAAVQSSAVQLDNRLLSVSSLSKCHGAPGLRIGWLIVRDPRLRELVTRAKFNTIISCPPVSERLAVSLLGQSGDFIGQRRLRLGENLAVLEQWIAKNQETVQWVRPDAGALCCVQLKPNRFDDQAVERCYAAMQQNDVRVARGDWFGEQARVFRLGFGLTDAPRLKEGLDRLERAIDLVYKAMDVKPNVEVG